MGGYPRSVSRLAACALIGVAALTGCSDDGTAGAEAASDESPAPATSSADGSPEPTLGEQEQDLLDRMASGVGSQGSARVVVRTSGTLRSTARGVVAYDSDGSRIRMATTVPAMGAEPTRLVVTDDTTYVSAPGLTPPGKYLAMAADDPRLQQWTGGGGDLDPRDSLAGFRAGLRSATELGAATVGGTPTTRYRLDVDARAALEAQGRTPPPAMPESTTYDVWLDDDGRIRRMTTQLAGSRVVVELTGWDEPVRITAPAPGDVVRDVG
jgi:hypothetical protein